MTPSEAFEVGFRLRCAEEGLTLDETAQRIKTAAMLKSAAPGSTISDMLKSLYQSGKWTLLFGPPVAGVLGGYALANMQNDAFDINEAKKDELMEEYDRATEGLQLRQMPGNA